MPRPHQRGKKKKSSRKGGRNNQIMTTTAPGAFKNLSLVFPPRMRLKLKFWAYQLLSLAASTSANYRWRPTGAFDIDPALGGTSMAGFAEAAAFYATYRVIASKIKATMANTSSVSPVTMIVLPMNSDPTNSQTTVNIIASLENPYAKSNMSGLLGCPSTKITSSMTTQKIFGDPAIYYDHNFTSLVNSVPANNWFWNVALIAPAFIATAITVKVEIEVDIEFFDRLFLPN